jgi:hypothetical protein
VREFDEVQRILGGAAVVGTEEAVGFAAAAAVVHARDIPTVRERLTAERRHVARTRRSAEAVQHDDEPLVAAAHPVDVEEVAVGRLDPLAGKREPPYHADLARVDCLGVRIPEEARGVVSRVLDQRHGESRN